MTSNHRPAAVNCKVARDTDRLLPVDWCLCAFCQLIAGFFILLLVDFYTRCVDLFPVFPRTPQSIQNIGNSQKKGAAAKTGRFGIGFNSVYHVSDVPSFVSGRHIVYFDPHARFLPKYVV